LATFLRHEAPLHEISESRMTGKPTRESGRIQTLHDLVNDDGYAALKRAGEDRDGWWRHRKQKRCQKPTEDTT